MHVVTAHCNTHHHQHGGISYHSHQQVAVPPPRHAAKVLTAAPPPTPVDHDVLETVLALTMHPVCQHVSGLAAGSTLPHRKHSKAPRPRLCADVPPTPPPASLTPPPDAPPAALELHAAASTRAVAALMVAQSSLLALHGRLGEDAPEAAGELPGDGDSVGDGSQLGSKGGMRRRGSRVTLTSHLPTRTPPILPVCVVVLLCIFTCLYMHFWCIPTHLHVCVYNVRMTCNTHHHPVPTHPTQASRACLAPLASMLSSPLPLHADPPLQLPSASTPVDDAWQRSASIATVGMLLQALQGLSRGLLAQGAGTEADQHLPQKLLALHIALLSGRLAIEEVCGGVDHECVCVYVRQCSIVISSTNGFLFNYN